MANLKTMGFEMINPEVFSEEDRILLLERARRIQRAEGYVSACGFRSGAGAKFPKRIRLWLPKEKKTDMLAFAKELRDRKRGWAV